MSKKQEEIITADIRVWLISGFFIDVEVEYESGGVDDIENALNSKTGPVYLMKNISEGICLTLKAEVIAGYEWI